MRDLEHNLPVLVPGLAASAALKPLLDEFHSRRTSAAEHSRALEAAKRGMAAAVSQDDDAAAEADRKGKADPGSPRVTKQKELIEQLERDTRVDAKAIAKVLADITAALRTNGAPWADEVAKAAVVSEQEANAALATFLSAASHLRSLREFGEWLRTEGGSKATQALPKGLPPEAVGKRWLVPGLTTDSGAPVSVDDVTQMLATLR